MNEFKATREGARTLVLTRNGQEMGRILFHKWSAAKADITMKDGTTCEVRPKGAWKSTTEIRQGEHVLADYKMTWRKGTELNTYFETINEQYHLRYRGFLKGRYELCDSVGEPVLTIRQVFKWKGFRTEFFLEPSLLFDRSKSKGMLMVFVLCCLTQQQRAQAASAAAAS